MLKHKLAAIDSTVSRIVGIGVKTFATVARIVGTLGTLGAFAIDVKTGATGGKIDGIDAKIAATDDTESSGV